MINPSGMRGGGGEKGKRGGLGGGKTMPGGGGGGGGGGLQAIDEDLMQENPCPGRDV